jgi:hypothetical protein
MDRAFNRLFQGCGSFKLDVNDADPPNGTLEPAFKNIRAGIQLDGCRGE